MEISKSVRRLAATAALVYALATAAGAKPWTMTVRDGFIVLYDESTGRCVRQFDVPASLLPPEDQQLLEAGLLLTDEAAWSRAAEDFLS